MEKGKLDITVGQATEENVQEEVRAMLESTDWADVCARRDRTRTTLGYKDIVSN